jgi:hypothetical protein
LPRLLFLARDRIQSGSLGKPIQPAELVNVLLARAPPRALAASAA